MVSALCRYLQSSRNHRVYRVSFASPRAARLGKGLTNRFRGLGAFTDSPSRLCKHTGQTIGHEELLQNVTSRENLFARPMSPWEALAGRAAHSVWIATATAMHLESFGEDSPGSCPVPITPKARSIGRQSLWQIPPPFSPYACSARLTSRQVECPTHPVSSSPPRLPCLGQFRPGYAAARPCTSQEPFPSISRVLRLALEPGHVHQAGVSWLAHCRH